MPSKLQKALKEYISKIKEQTPYFHFSSGSFSSTRSKILSGCKHPKSFSFVDGDRKSAKKDVNPERNDDNAATLEDIDRFLVENFRSLYGRDYDLDSRTTSKEREEKTRGSTTPGRLFSQHPDLCGSQRFLVSSGSSSSLFEEPGGRSTPGRPSNDGGSTSGASPRTHVDHGSPTGIPKGMDNCIAVLTVSPSPFEEFRRSMSEVIEARIQHNQRVDWDFMEKLLFCYLKLNEKKQYRYVLSAFVDVIATLRQISSTVEIEVLDRHDKYDRNFKGKERRD